MEAFMLVTGVPGVTFRMASTDIAQALTPTNLINAAGRRAIAVLITCETQNIRFAFGVTPTEGASGLGHIIYPEGSFNMASARAAQTFRFISAAAGVHGALLITPFFEE